MDTEEMFRRGSEDAERGEPDPFYYQHYYHYRRGFDQTRRRQHPFRSIRNILLIGGVLLLVVLGGAYFLRTPLQTQEVVASDPEQLSVPTATPRPLFPTPTPLPPTPTPAPPQGLHADGEATITNTEGKALRGRSEPSLEAPVQVSFSEGERVRVLEGPVEADGLRWWRVEGAKGIGWSAELSSEGAVWLTPNT